MFTLVSRLIEHLQAQGFGKINVFHSGVAAEKMPGGDRAARVHLIIQPVQQDYAVANQVIRQVQGFLKKNQFELHPTTLSYPEEGASGHVRAWIRHRQGNITPQHVQEQAALSEYLRAKMLHQERFAQINLFRDKLRELEQRGALRFDLKQGSAVFLPLDKEVTAEDLNLYQGIQARQAEIQEAVVNAVAQDRQARRKTNKRRLMDAILSGLGLLQSDLKTPAIQKPESTPELLASFSTPVDSVTLSYPFRYRKYRQMPSFAPWALDLEVVSRKRTAREVKELKEMLPVSWQVR